MKDRFHLFHFDPAGDAADAGGGDGGATVDSAPAADPAASAAAPEPQYVTRDDIQSLVQFRDQALPVLSRLNDVFTSEEEELFGGDVPGGSDGGDEDFDPFDPNAIASLSERAAQKALEPFTGILGMMAAEKGEQLAKQALEEIKTNIGEFDTDATFLIANSMLNDPNNRANPQQTLAQVASWVKERDEKIGAAAVEKYKAEIAALAGAPKGEAPAGTGAAAPVEKVPTGPGRYEEALQRALARRNPSPVVQ